MLNPESILENETHKILRFRDTKESHNFGQTTRPSQQKKKKKKMRENQPNSGFCRSGWQQSKIESEKKDKSLDLAREAKRHMEYESVGNTNCN